MAEPGLLHLQEGEPVADRRPRGRRRRRPGRPGPAPARRRRAASAARSATRGSRAAAGAGSPRCGWPTRSPPAPPPRPSGRSGPHRRRRPRPAGRGSPSRGRRRTARRGRRRAGAASGPRRERPSSSDTSRQSRYSAPSSAASEIAYAASSSASGAAPAGVARPADEQRVEREERLARRPVVARVGDREVPDRVPAGERGEQRVAEAAEGMGQGRRVELLSVALGQPTRTHGQGGEDRHGRDRGARHPEHAPGGAQRSAACAKRRRNGGPDAVRCPSLIRHARAAACQLLDATTGSEILTAVGIVLVAFVLAEIVDRALKRRGRGAPLAGGRDPRAARAAPDLRGDHRVRDRAGAVPVRRRQGGGHRPARLVRRARPRGRASPPVRRWRTRSPGSCSRSPSRSGSATS